MQCPRCQHENRPQAKFCEECAAPLVRSCSNCGTQLSTTAKFCPECAHPVAAAVATHAGFASPEAYTPKHLAEKILTSRSALEGERKQVTVLFCDIVDSSRLAERLDPEGMHGVMDRALRLMAEAVHRYEGTVNQFLGDGIMALFGAPVALEDHAFRAVQAALAIQETLAGYSQQLKQERGEEIRLRQGLNTGMVVVGRIGDDLRMDYTAVGDTTHLAARVQGLAEPGTTLVTEATHRLVAGYVRTEALGPVGVKGRSEPVQVYKVVGRRRGRTRLEVSAERGLTELVGRERELGLLHDCLARVKAGRGQVVGIVGEPGVGKSRLLYELRKSLEGERVTWLEGHCVAYGQATPYLPVLEILRTNFQIEEWDNPLQIQEKLRQGVHRLDPGLEGILPFLQALFGLPSADDALKHLDPKDKRQRTFEAVRTLTMAGSQRRPHVVIVEDLHWIDKTSEDYLAFLTAGLAGVPLLLVTTHRPGYTVRWADRTYYTQIALDVLAEGETEALVAGLLGSRTLPADLLRIVHEKAEGNPLFVEEITTSLLERGMLLRRNGEIIWAGGAPVEVPASIQDLVRARIDRLEEPVKRTVQAAAVIGREFGVRLLTRISEMAAEVQQYLETLKHVELIHETRFFPELEYIFKHAVIQDVAYQSLLTQRRKEIHGAIGGAVEDLYADRLEEQAPILAYHYARSERQDKAVEYTLLAGDRAARLYANAEAKTYYERALATGRTLPVSAEAQRWQIDAALKLATVAVTREDMQRDQANLQTARAVAERLQDRARLARVLYWLGRIQYVLGDPHTAIEYARQSLEIAESLGDDALAAPPVNLMARAYSILSEFSKAAPLIKQSIEQMRRIGNKTEEASAAAYAGWVLGPLGEFDSAFQYLDRGLQLARDIQNPFTEAAALLFHGVTSIFRGEWNQAIGDFEEARRIAERTGDLFRVYMTKHWEGWARTRSGDPGRGRVLLEEALVLGVQLGTKMQLSYAKANLAASLVALDDLDAVPGLCQEAIQLAGEAGDRLGKALAHRTLAEAVSRLDPSDRQKAERAILQAIRIQQEIGARPELARSYVSYARLLEAWGERDRGREHLTRAVGMFREMGMAWDLERAGQALREF
ncbi:MAG: AAA family ATPase [Candidatus Rokubacteria bacterium]|nr:AAA family ATPase [Candidatus Rokubacteria bacterium]